MLQVSLVSNKFWRTYLRIYSVINFVIQFLILVGTDYRGENDDEYF